MDVSPAALLLVDGPGLHGGVIGPRQHAGEGDHVAVPVLQELLQIHGGRGAGRLGGVGPCAHFLEELALPEILAVHHRLRADLNGQGDLLHMGVRAQLRGEIGAAVANQSICHFKYRLK